jgi:hypothetical protein
MGSDYVTAATEAFPWTLKKGRRLSLRENLLDVLKKYGAERLRRAVIKMKSEYEEDETDDQEKRNILCIMEHL